MTWIIVTGTLCLLAVLVIARWIYIRGLEPGAHARPRAELLAAVDDDGLYYGSMSLAEERDWRARIRPDGLVYTDAAGEVHVKAWEPPHGAEAGAMWPKIELWNGHTIGCVRPDEDHLGACPEGGDDPDEPYDWPVPGLPDMLPAGPVEEDPGLVDAALAPAADDPGDAGWTDELLAELHDLPTVLDDTWEQRDEAEERQWCAEEDYYAAELAAALRAQDDDAAKFLAEMATDAAQFSMQAKRPL